MRRESGTTLIEVLIAVTLLSLLSVGMLTAMRVGFMAFSKTNDKLMADRRVAGAQRVVQEELEGFMPVVAPCGDLPSSIPAKTAFFEGQPESMRLVSTFSLQQGWRGQPQILELFVIPGENGAGVRLVVNEIPYTGPAGTAQLCTGRARDPVTGGNLAVFAPVQAGPNSFVLADKLAYCRFSYFTIPLDRNVLPHWIPQWTFSGWPYGVRIEMAPLDPDPSRLHPITVTAPIHIHRAPEIQYVDY
ncbi:MAG TPA: prepilin-type N-terminal cleavage/methylation domain-containing protein [Bryobacteraceae bacterium]|nr:prepilin-type N-terminal cleavage/methylation domain-containing protein [Bryobacteraceae bacterium]